MGKPVDLTGQRFARLLVLGEGIGTRKPSGKAVRQWLCRCDCGTEVIVSGDALKSKNTRSCGCLHREQSRKNGMANRRHGMIESSTYKSWASMLSRCRYASKPENRHHAGSGVTVCARWDPRQGGSFENFLSDMGKRPEGKTLDRYPDQAGDYEPQNCRWATPEEQANNQKSNVWVTYKGKQLTLSQAAKESGIHPDTLGLRYRKGERGDHLFRPTAHTGRRAWKSQGGQQSCAGSSLVVERSNESADRASG